VSLTNLLHLDLSGNEKLEFGALSRWLKRSSVISLDLFNLSLWNDPSELTSIMKSTKKLKHLRFAPFILLLAA